MNHNVAKMVCIVVLGSVIKSLYGRPVTNVHNHYPDVQKDDNTEKEES